VGVINGIFSQLRGEDKDEGVMNELEEEGE